MYSDLMYFFVLMLSILKKPANNVFLFFDYIACLYEVRKALNFILNHVLYML